MFNILINKIDIVFYISKVYKVNNTTNYPLSKNYNRFQTIMFPFWKMISYTRPHGGIVIGKGGHHIKHLARMFGCFITSKRAEPERKRFKPYFLIEGYNERSVFMATMHIQELLLESMTKIQETYRSELNDLGQQNQHLNLVIAEKEETRKKTYMSSEQVYDELYKCNNCGNEWDGNAQCMCLGGMEESEDEEESDNEEGGIKVCE